jgi:capsular exopolysaccharide synthesis family protein
VERTTPELRDYLAILWRRRWIVALVTIGAIALSLLNSFRESPTYVSTAEVLVLPIQDPEGRFGSPFVEIENEVQIATSEPVDALVEQDPPTSSDGSVGVGAISVTALEDSDILLFTSVAGDPVLAQQTAKRYSEEYLNYRKQAVVDLISDESERLQTQIDDLEVQLANEPSSVARQLISQDLRDLESQRDDLEYLQGQIRPGELLDSAGLPSGPASPNHQKAFMLGLALGLLLGVGGAFLLERLDPLLRSREEIEATTGLPILGMIPDVQVRTDVMGVATRVADRSGDPIVQESYRALRARILFAASQQPIRTLVMTSAKEGEGKTTTSLGLARSLAEAGRRVIFVAADLRRPTLDRHVPEAKGRKGLADVLAGRARIEEALVATPVEHLLVMPPGAPSREAERGLGTLPVDELLDALRAHAEFVVVDTTPVLGVSDALDVARHVDAVMFAIDARRTHRSEIVGAIDDLRSVGAPLLGVVITNHDPARFRPHAHYYSTYVADGIEPTHHYPTAPRVVGEPPTVLPTRRPPEEPGSGASSLP